MSAFGPEIVDQVVAACSAGAEEAKQALSRTFDVPIELALGAAETLNLGALPESLQGPGLAVVLTVGGHAALALIPESSQLLPNWYRQPDPTGTSKLTTLAQELGMLLLPEAFMPEDFQAGYVSDLAAAIQRGGVLDGAAVMPLELTSGGQTGRMSLVWPGSSPKSVIEPVEQPPAPPPAAKEPPSPAPSFAVAARGSLDDDGDGFANLPTYSRSLLKIKVPVVVTLASTRQPVRQIVELGPGMIIQFDKACDQMLDLEIGDQQVASGEAVKVGDKFGLRITSMIMPGERFESIATNAAPPGPKRVL